MSLPDPNTWPGPTFETILLWNPPKVETIRWHKMVREDGECFWKAEDTKRPINECETREIPA